jgi:hypothetical protein
MNRIIILGCISFFICTGCSNSGTKHEHSYEYVPLSEYKVDSANIKPDAEVRIIGFSGGDKSEKDQVNYFQFLVTEKESGDTVRILAPLICITKEAGVENDTYTTPSQFDGSKGVFDAVFVLKDSTQNMMINVDAAPLPTDENIESIKNSLSNTVNGKEMVVVNKSIPNFENPAYKTAIGILKFNKKPW